MADPDSIASILWSSEPTTQSAIGLVVAVFLFFALTVHLPLAIRLARLSLLQRKLRAKTDRDPDAKDPQAILSQALKASPIAEAFAEFERRWSTAQLEDARGRAPIRLLDILDDRPLLPLGPRRSLLPLLPGLFVGLGAFAALYGLIPSLTTTAAALEVQPARLAAELGLALRAAAWGFLCALAASLSGRLLGGGFDALSAGLDDIVERHFGSISPGELAEFTRQTQQRGLDTLGRELTRFADELNQRLDRGLQRIEQSTARSAALVSEEQRGALHNVVQELSLSVRQGVEQHLSELRKALQQAIDHQTSVTGGLAETFERMVENAQSQDRVAHTLSESAGAVEAAARSLQSAAVEMKPVLDHLGTTSGSLSETADQMRETQRTVARSAEGVRSSLEHAANGVDDQRQFVERSLSEIRRALVGLGDGLGDSLQRALREVDDALGSTVGQLRETLVESNETIERLSAPVRAAEGATREVHVALDRVRNEVEALGQWMHQSLKPLRGGLNDFGTHAEEIRRAIQVFADRTRQIDQTMDALREEIQAESRQLQGSGSELGRKMTRAADAIGNLEIAAAEGTTEARSEWVPDKRSWTPTPRAPGAQGNAGPTPSENTDTPPRLDPPTAAAAPPPSPRSSQDPAHGPLPEQTDSGAEGGLSEKPTRRPEGELSGYRISTPKAMGPDPYARFDSGADLSSNVPLLETQERELGEGHKLSELLSPKPRPEPINGDEDESGRIPPAHEDTE